VGAWHRCEQAALIERRMCLSAQESQIMQGLLADRSDNALMLELGISRGTLRTYFDRLFSKCDTRDLVQRVVEHVSLSILGVHGWIGANQICVLESELGSRLFILAE
jgi:FixJ family two-component response regulator